MRTNNPAGILVAAMVVAGSSLSCGGAGPAGTWRAVFDVPGGELPFGIRIEDDGRGGLKGACLNGDEALAFTTVTLEDRKITLRYDHLDSELTADLSEDGASMSGTWTRQSGRNRPTMPFHAARASEGKALVRFLPSKDGTAPATGAGAPPDITGEYDVVFKDEEGASPARAEFRQEGSRLLGTFLTPSGDYRFLEGDYVDGFARLSCFDGVHAYLFHARPKADGTIEGDFWARTTYHATWSARRAVARLPGEETAPAGGGTPSGAAVSASAAAAAAGGEAWPAMPDPFTMTKVKSADGRLRFSLPDLDGRTVTQDDPRFAGKVLLVEVFGSWCPNCNDQAPVLEELYGRYHDRGLEIVGLAFEMTGDAARDAAQVRKYAERHGIRYTLLLAGTNARGEPANVLTDLDSFNGYPTLVFVGRDGMVKAIHTGFAGPGTGAHFAALKKRYLEIVEGLL